MELESWKQEKNIKKNKYKNKNQNKKSGHQQQKYNLLERKEGDQQRMSKENEENRQEGVHWNVHWGSLANWMKNKMIW